ncbi:MAG: class I SAM-dependent methyltransferase [Acutalibacteraceae bacterium]
MSNLEKMADFFAARVDKYDEHMLSEVEGCREGYAKMAALVPKTARRLLDLGCGTGLELDEILKLMPGIEVTGVDLTQEMLDRLKEKHSDKNINLICGDYFTVDFGAEKFDCAVSFQTMHHFALEKKRELYKKINNALALGGLYIECDYMVKTQAEQDFYFAECARMRREQNIPDGEFCHYDTPCSVENQISLLKSAGFSSVEKVFEIENTVMLTARK